MRRVARGGRVRERLVDAGASRTAAECVRTLSSLCTAMGWILRECAAGYQALGPESVGRVRGRVRYGLGASSTKWSGGRNSADAHACLPTERLLHRGGECHALWVTVACNCSAMVLFGCQMANLVWGRGRGQQSGGGYGHEPKDPHIFISLTSCWTFRRLHLARCRIGPLRTFRRLSRWAPPSRRSTSTGGRDCSGG